MFAPQSSPADSPKTKDVVLCERSEFPLTLPSALVTSIWDRINEGVRAVPRGGAEVGGLMLAKPGQTGTIFAADAVPIQTEHRFGPAFRLSDVDLANVRSLISTLQKDPSKTVVGVYRSRTRQDGSQESDGELLALLEEAHASFAAHFRYYIAFTPVTKMTMTASISVRRDDGWDDWRHVMLRWNPMSATEPILLEDAPKPAPVQAQAEPQAAAAETPLSARAQAEPRTETAPPEAGKGHTASPLAAAAQPALAAAAAASAYAAPAAAANAQAETAASGHFALSTFAARQVSAPAATHAPAKRRRMLKTAAAGWYAGGAIALAAIALGGYLRSTSSQPRITITETPIRIKPTPDSVHVSFSAAREGPLWRLTWDRAAIAALNPGGAILAIRDGSKDQQIQLDASDLSNGTILYTPQSSDLLFSLNIVLPDNQVAEEHVRVLEAPHSAPAPSASDLEEPVKLQVRDQVRALRPFSAPKMPTRETALAKPGALDVPPPPTLTANSPAGAGFTGLNTLGAPPRDVPGSAVPASVLPAMAAPSAPSPQNIGPRVMHRVSPTLTSSLPSGAAAQIQIRVQIDAKGSVSKVTPITTSSSYVNFRLVEAASRAAKDWVFDPARKDGHPVPSEMVLDFHFGGAQ